MAQPPGRIPPAVWWDYGQPEKYQPPPILPEPGLLPSPQPPTLNDPRPRRPKARPRVSYLGWTGVGQLSMEQTNRRRDWLAAHQSPYAPNIYPAPQTRPGARFGVIVPELLQQILTPVIAEVLFAHMGRFDYCKLQWALGRLPCMHYAPVAGPGPALGPAPKPGQCDKFSTQVIRQGSYGGRIDTCVSGASCQSLLDWPPHELAQMPWPNRMWVCESHVAVRGTDDDIIQFHRVGTCSVCRRRERRNHPGEFSSCVCEEILRPQHILCNPCYTESFDRLVNNFRHRVNRPAYHGRANRFITGVNIPNTPARPDYWKDSPGLQAVREMPVDHHPCSSGCGRDRDDQTEVMDCRSCGGLVTEPMAHNGRKRALANIYGDANILLALDDNGIPVITQELSGRNGRRRRRGA